MSCSGIRRADPFDLKFGWPMCDILLALRGIIGNLNLVQKLLNILSLIFIDLEIKLFFRKQNHFVNLKASV